MSLNGYEETALAEQEEEDEGEEDMTHETETTSTALETPQQGEDDDEHTATGADRNPSAAQEEDDSFTVDSPTQVTGVQSTPKLSATTSRQKDVVATSGGGRRGFKTSTTSAASLRSPSPRKYTGRNPLALSRSSQPGPSTPKSAQRMQSSPFEPDSAFKPPPSTTRRQQRPQNHNNDPLMHRGVLDKNYRVQATPHTQRRQRAHQANPPPTKTTPQTTTTKTQAWDDSPDSSPALAAPQLRSDLFSPAKPRTPGLSVLTPQRGRAPTTSTGRHLFSPADKTYAATTTSRQSHLFSSAAAFSDDEDDEDDAADAMSPPKTLQFHVPASRLVQTPAREASRRIVEDLLLTAGADETGDEGEEEGWEGMEGREGKGEGGLSPSVMARAAAVGLGEDDDDTF